MAYQSLHTVFELCTFIPEMVGIERLSFFSWLVSESGAFDLVLSLDVCDVEHHPDLL